MSTKYVWAKTEPTHDAETNSCLSCVIVRNNVLPDGGVTALWGWEISP